MRHLFLLMAVIGLPLVAAAQAAKPLPLADLAVYKGADREQALVSGAKKKVRSSGTRPWPADRTKNLRAHSKQNMASKSRRTAGPAKISFPRFWRKRRPKGF